MAISTDDCKALLSKDMPLIASGAIDPKGWKRLSKKNGAQGVERVFSHSSGMFALVVEAAGSIRVHARSSTLEGLAPSAPAAAPAPAPAAKAAPSKFWPAASPRFIDVEKARVLAEKLANFWNTDDDDEAFERLEARFEKLDPVAAASQYTFAISFSSDGLAAIITPSCVWRDESRCHDQESPISHLLPDGSDDLNGCGTWDIPGYTEGDPACVPAMALDLLSRGFVWDEAFQEMIDRNSEMPAIPLLAPITEGRALEAAASNAPASSRSAPRV